MEDNFASLDDSAFMNSISSAPDAEEKETAETVETEETVTTYEEEDERNNDTTEEDTPTDTAEKDTADVEDKTDEVSEDKDSDKEPDYKGLIESLFSPFNASGKEMSVRTVEEARTLMQKGVDYYKKMNAIKPSLKAVRLLDSHNLLDNEKLNYLIDLHERKPEAIKRLLKESKFDVMEYDEDAENTYVPNKREVSDGELELADILDTIGETPNGAKTLRLVTEQWDAKSKAHILKNPELLTTINDHFANGVYDKVSAELDRLKTLGQVPKGYSDFQAYWELGTEMWKRGMLGSSPPNANTTVNTNQKTEPPKPKSKSVSLPKEVKPTKDKTPNQYDVSKMNDDDFKKLLGNF